MVFYLHGGSLRDFVPFCSSFLIGLDRHRNKTLDFIFDGAMERFVHCPHYDYAGDIRQIIKFWKTSQVCLFRVSILGNRTVCQIQRIYRPLLKLNYAEYIWYPGVHAFSFLRYRSAFVVFAPIVYKMDGNQIFSHASTNYSYFFLIATRSMRFKCDRSENRCEQWFRSKHIWRIFISY